LFLSDKILKTSKQKLSFLKRNEQLASKLLQAGKVFICLKSVCVLT